uniref:electron transport complex subunit RsxC n=1 Tax=uncultured Cardiobacterium sp. TaxID=417619 RepID=UPI00261BFA6C
MIKQLLARLLPGKTTFHGGIHITPPGHKTMSTARPSREAALCDEYAISLIQHDGTPFIAQVAVGDRVLRGQLLAAPANHRDAPVHAPTSGTIRAIEPRPDMHPSNRPVPHLILASDGEDQSAPPLPALDIETATPDELRARIHDCGIVGLGGAGFPTARKLGHPANTLVINAAECEPYITCDDLQIRENAAAIIRGAQITARILGADNIHFGIEDDKPEAIAALRAALDAAADPRIRISSVPVRYPSGNARQLFELLLGIRVPADAHASDYGLICHNSGTMKAVYDAVSLGLPLTERYTTISGEGIREPQVLRIRIGTAARDLIQQSGGERHEHSAENRHIIGGPMMGYEIASLDTPLQKTGNSLLILPAAPAPEETPCIRCSRCADACPMELLPQQLLWYSQSNQHNRLKQYRLFDCIECGICAAVCPSGIPLVQYYRHSKGDIRAADKKTQDAEHARTRHEARTARLEREAAERQAQMDARRAKLREAAANPAPAAPATPITRQDPNPPAKYTPVRPQTVPSGTTTASDDKASAIEAAKARAAARKAARLAASGK